VDGKLVVESFAYGTGYDRVELVVDRVSGDVVTKSAGLEATTHEGVTPDGDLARFVAGYAGRVAPLGDRVVGRLGEALDSDGLTQLAAHAQRAYAGADVAFVNAGNTRRPSLDAGRVTYAEAFLVHAYEHPVLRLEMRGADVLEAWRDRGRVHLFESGLEGVRPTGTYTVAVNGVLAAASRFPAFGRATTRHVMGTDLEALVAWLGRS